MGLVALDDLVQRGDARAERYYYGEIDPPARMSPTSLASLSALSAAEYSWRGYRPVTAPGVGRLVEDPLSNHVCAWSIDHWMKMLA
jgi:hypothetical protein